MGQRFQVIIERESRIKVYHFQWLWGDYAIKRLGTAVKNFLKYNETGYYNFLEYLKGSCYGKPQDMNTFHRYDDEVNEYEDDNEWLNGNFLKAIKTLDNNDGYFYISFDKDNKLIGYCFILNDYDNPKMTSLNAVEYMANYQRTDGLTNTQEKEYQDGLKTFSKLKVITPIKIIKK